VLGHNRLAAGRHPSAKSGTGRQVGHVARDRGA
jgi:hypothetical protein